MAGASDYLIVAAGNCRPMKRPNLSNLTGLRALAICMVLWIHSLAFLPNTSFKHIVLSFVLGGFFGVPVFFALSGFLIAKPFFDEYAAGESVRMRSYAVKRIAKILPPFLLSLALAIAVQIHFASQPVPVILADALKTLFFLQPFLTVHTKLNGGIYWSLPPEVYYYTLFPICFLLLRRLGLLASWGGASSISVALGILSATCMAVYSRTGNYGWTLGGYYLFFAVGSFAALVATRGSQKLLGLRRLDGFAILLLMGSAGYFGWNSCAGRHVSPMHLYEIQVPAALALFFLLLPVPDGSDRWLEKVSTTWFVKTTAMISYEWYLFHLPILACFMYGRDVTAGNIFQFSFKCILPIIVSWLVAFAIHRYYSLPLHRYIVRRWAVAETHA